MVSVAGLWELGWNTPIKEADLWEFPLRDFGAERWHMSPISGIAHTFVDERPDLAEVIADYRARGVPVVFVDEKGTTPLRAFEHPADALYVLGKTSLSPLVAYGRDGDLSVRVETALDGGLLWAHQAAALVLYDRQVKSCR